MAYRKNNKQYKALSCELRKRDYGPNLQPARGTYSKELSILFKKLGQVTVPESSYQYNIFIQTWISSLKRSSHDKHRLDCSHTKVIMILLRELFTAQSVHLDHLTSKVFRRFKAFRVQNHFSNQGCKEKKYMFWTVLCNVVQTVASVCDILQRGHWQWAVI